jgi:hypothetical protein
MQYLLLVIALAVSVVLAARYVPMRGDGLFPEGMQEQVEQMKNLQNREAPQDVAPENLPEGLTGQGSGSEKREKAYYRWRGDDGSWHYGDRPPAGVEYERVEPNPVTTRPAEQLRGEATGDKGQGSD